MIVECCGMFLEQESDCEIPARVFACFCLLASKLEMTLNRIWNLGDWKDDDHSSSTPLGDLSRKCSKMDGGSCYPATGLREQNPRSQSKLAAHSFGKR